MVEYIRNLTSTFDIEEDGRDKLWPVERMMPMSQANSFKSCCDESPRSASPTSASEITVTCEEVINLKSILRKPG